MKYKVTIKTKHANTGPTKLEPTFIDNFECDIFELAEAKEKARQIGLSYIMNPNNEKTPGIVANNGISITIEEIK